MAVFIYEHPVEIISALCVVFAVIIVLLLIYMKNRINSYEMIHRYEENYRMLADAFVQANVEYDFQNDRLVFLPGKGCEIDLPGIVDNFREKLTKWGLRITVTEEEFSRLCDNAEPGKIYQAEFQCGMKEGGWNWFNMIYIVVRSDDNCRPVTLLGCLLDAEKQHQTQEKLVELGQYDKLTGVYNRVGAESQIIGALESLEEYSESAFLLMDVDWFKQMNDSYGHLCGDDVLKAIGRNIREIFQGDTILCRWGGDEFLMFVRGPGASKELLEQRIQELRRRMNQFQYGDMDYPVTLSIGGIVPVKGMSLEKVFQQADEVLYQVKRNGRNDFRIRKVTAIQSTK